MKKKQNRRQTKGPDAGRRPAGETVQALTAAKVAELAEPLCLAEGLELVATEFRRERGGRTLRLVIDRPGGVSLDDCVAVSRQLSDLLDVYLEQQAPYHLEVSSPGPNRPLVKQGDFLRFKGNKAKISTLRPIGGRRQFTGILQGLAEGRVHLQVDGVDAMAIPLEQVKQARLVNYHGEK